MMEKPTVLLYREKVYEVYFELRIVVVLVDLFEIEDGELRVKAGQQ